jgi:hypothetical protein
VVRKETRELRRVVEGKKVRIEVQPTEHPG